MKKLFLLFFIWLYPSIGFSVINEYKTDVYFANGIKTDKDDAFNNTLLLEKSIRIKRYNDNEEEMYKYIGKVTEAYNETHLAGLGDLAESLAQKLGMQGVIDDLEKQGQVFTIY